MNTKECRKVVKDEQRPNKDDIHLGNILDEMDFSKTNPSGNPTYHNINDESPAGHYVKSRCNYCGKQLKKGNALWINGKGYCDVGCHFAFTNPRQLIAQSKDERSLIDRRTIHLQEHVELKYKDMFTDRKHFPPNNRLLNQIASLMQAYGIEVARSELNVGTGRQRVVNWNTPNGGVPYLLFSSPWYGTSYLVVCRYDGTFLEREFVCNNPGEAIGKLLRYGCIEAEQFTKFDLSEGVKS